MRKADEIFIEVHREVRRRRHRRLRIASAAVVLVALIAITARSPNVAPLDAPPATAVPSVTTVVTVPLKRMLPDGSAVELKDGAEISSQFNASVRRVVLVKGEAHFQVEKESGRAFVVVASRIEIRAVGTAFSVEMNEGAVGVLVTEGQIAVQGTTDHVQGTTDHGHRPDDLSERATETESRGQKTEDSEQTSLLSPPSSVLRSPSSGILIEAGNRVVLETATSQTSLANPRVTRVSPAEIAERLAWRVPRLRFSGTPLAEAIPMFNRHSRVQVVAGDPELGKLKLSGVLRADDIESLIQLLDAEFGIKAESRDEQNIVLRK